MTLAVVSDDVPAIQSKLLEWSDGPSPARLIFTTGGTGFGVSVLRYFVVFLETLSVSYISVLFR